jgi:acetamidase/formamidase
MEDAKNAVRDMIDWLVTDQQLSLHQAYLLCSVVGDLKISETVDIPNWLVSMTFPAASSAKPRVRPQSRRKDRQ